MLKFELREIYRKKRAALSPELLAQNSLSIANQLLQWPLWDYSYFHLFLNESPSFEVDTSALLTVLQGQDKNVVVPRVVPPRSLEHILLTDNTLFRKNSWGIPEPVNGLEVEPKLIDVVFLPLLVYDQKGNRLGYGKGFYDGFLHQCRPDVLKIGLSFFPPEEKVWEVEAHDIPLDACATPDKIYRFNSRP
jgi:5-formyltetrahydrofolate cyclo-ligase